MQLIIRDLIYRSPHNIKATGMIKYGSIYKHKYEMVGWCSKNSSGIVDDGKITGFHAI